MAVGEQGDWRATPRTKHSPVVLILIRRHAHLRPAAFPTGDQGTIARIPLRPGGGPRAKIASRHVARIVRLGTVLVEAGGVSRCTTGAADSRSPIWLAGAAALVEAGGVSRCATGFSRSPVRLPGTGELAARGRAM